ncbi:hypothetical protein IQE94_07615 [Synechocystis sp. PCC 7339]|uniref:hypothetical protein n=1 Tax=unclassified Synechocystis TaxID=2640012 RepID=UPI001BB089A9|nr:MULTISPECIES: hypothetical protein [unclassified Synechocystis]QUS61913.1 hypothetical protein HTZ78_15405 [Synechocystis sp. PCC 7338]UAJ74107.1 hypothetical protein IQE94_07615 [Synechocystis sp. PCC 7339]
MGDKIGNGTDGQCLWRSPTPEAHCTWLRFHLTRKMLRARIGAFPWRSGRASGSTYGEIYGALAPLFIFTF